MGKHCHFFSFPKISYNTRGVLERCPEVLKLLLAMSWSTFYEVFVQLSQYFTFVKCSCRCPPPRTRNWNCRSVDVEKYKQHYLFNTDCPFGNNWSTSISCGLYLITYFPLWFKTRFQVYLRSLHLQKLFVQIKGTISIVFGHLHTCCLLLVCEYMRYPPRNFACKSKVLLQTFYCGMDSTFYSKRVKQARPNHTNKTVIRGAIKKFWA